MSCPEHFTTGMRRLAAGVCLITTTDGHARHGLVATAVTSVSAAPPTLLVCVNRQASIHEHILGAGRFAVNVLSAAQADIAARFASPADRETRFDAGRWISRTTGAPILEAACVSFDCLTSATTTQGTHTVLFGLVQDVWLQQAAPPLTYFEGSFGTLAEL